MELKKYLKTYWWGLPAIIAFLGMLASTLPSVEFSRSLQLVFFGISLLAAFGWFTRKKVNSKDQEYFSESEERNSSKDN